MCCLTFYSWLEISLSLPPPGTPTQHTGLLPPPRHTTHVLCSVLPLSYTWFFDSNVLLPAICQDPAVLLFPVTSWLKLYLKKKKIKVEIHVTQSEPFWNEQFHGIQYIHVMQPPSPSSSKTFPAFQNKTFSSLNSPFNTLPAPGHHQSASCLYGFVLSWIFHMNGITQDVTFCVWLRSLSLMFSRLT